MADRKYVKSNLKRLYVMAILLLTVLYPISLEKFNIYNRASSAIPNIKQENIDINLVLIGFDSDYIFEDDLESSLPVEIDPFLLFEVDPSFPHSNYEINYLISYLSEDKVTDLEEFILDNAIFDPLFGYRVNNTALDEYLSSQSYDNFMDFFIPCEGYTIDAGLVENYIYQNIHSEFEDTSHYTLYLMNFSSIDAEDHSIEHSYVPSYVDCDSNRSTDLSLAGKEERNAVGWGGNYRFCYADLSAISENLFQYTFGLGSDLNTAPLYYRYDLDTFTEVYNIETISGKNALTNYISEWIISYVRNVFLSSTLYTPPVFESFYLPIKVFNNIADRGYPYETMTWAFNSERIHNYLSEAFPWIEWLVEYDLKYLTDYPEIYQHLVDHTFNNGEYNYINVEDVIEILNAYTDEF